MIGTSFAEWIFIRLSIQFFRYAPLIYATALLVLVLIQSTAALLLLLPQVLCGLLLVEALFYAFIYRPYLVRLKAAAKDPIPLSPADRKVLFTRCLITVPSPELYLQWWFLGADPDEIRRDNVREFVLWAFFERGDDVYEDAQEAEEELDEYISIFEEKLGRKFQPGRGNAKSLRLTLDAIHTSYRSPLWYMIVFFIDQATHLAMVWHGFEYYGRPTSSALRIFPPRPQELLARHKSPAPQLSYWHRPHTATDKLPVIFFHGIGIGLWTYTHFLADIHKASKSSQGDVGIIAIEVLPVSFRLTSPIPDKTEFLEEITKILDHHCWENFTVVAHSYGSVLTTHMLHSPSLQQRIPSVVLIDPVTIMLHLPDVAYNFTRRMPKRANEWQLWYFASTDPAVALCLGRHFFWRENIIWKDELLSLKKSGRETDRKVAVCMSGRDLIVNTAAVAEYLTNDVEAEVADDGSSVESGGVKVVLFPKLDHAQVFDEPADCKRVVELITSRCGSELVPT
ncbi:hypothetical protein G7046_g2698 [Stylonectria norvegica]|nr:hypothetical protein G7046_g2698 [Stylonectria norvegica]